MKPLKPESIKAKQSSEKLLRKRIKNPIKDKEKFFNSLIENGIIR